MRALLPDPRPDVDLEQSYAYPPDRAWLRANMVSSLDGAAAADGHSHGLSSRADKRLFRVLRSLADVVVVGAGTARAEGYAGVTRGETEVAARRARGQSDTPAIAVVSNSLDLDPGSGLFVGVRTGTLVITHAAAVSAQPQRTAALREVADVIVAGDRAVDLPAAIGALAERGLARMVCEGGPRLLSRLAAAGCLDELCLTLSPLLTGGDAPRILTGATLAPYPRMRCAHLLEEEGSLFTRYVLDR